MDAPAPDPSAEMTAAEYYIEVARNERKPYFIHPDLEGILGETHGVIVFQEQTLEIFRELAGYSYEQAEIVRRAIGKKIKELLEEHGSVLKSKLQERGWTTEQGDRLFDSIMASARYSFNRSHAVSYAMVAYNGCYLKHHYPLHFWKGELTKSLDDHDKIRDYLKGCGGLSVEKLMNFIRLDLNDIVV
jgi:DNA polymerase-3 subunit alpha